MSVQNHYSLLHRAAEAEVIPACREHDVGFCRTSRSRAACSPASTSRGAAMPENPRLQPPPEPRRRADRRASSTRRSGSTSTRPSTGRACSSWRSAGLAALPAVASVIAVTHERSRCAPTRRPVRGGSRRRSSTSCGGCSVTTEAERTSHDAIAARYRERTPDSLAYAEEIKDVMAGGRTGFGFPYPTVIQRGEGPYLVDIDGNRYLNFWNAYNLHI